jgi:hypothetical protein
MYKNRNYLLNNPKAKILEDHRMLDSPAKGEYDGSILKYYSLVSLLDILQAHVEAYSRAAHVLTIISVLINEDKRNNKDVRKNTPLLQRLKGHLEELLLHCEYLPITAVAISKLVKVISTPEIMSGWKQTSISLMGCIAEIQSRLEDELSQNLFFKLPQDKKKYFDNYKVGWEEVISRFPETESNIEEMSKCFALSRYAAAVYHACQAIESGLIYFGTFLEVPDPKSGWTAVTNRFTVLLEKTKYPDLPQKYKDCFGFLEQMRAVTQALKSAWRNKIDHAQSSLILMTVDFTPDIAEEIMMASRAFMRRLATEMP